MTELCEGGWADWNTLLTSQLDRPTKQMREAEQRLKAIPQFCFPDAKDWSPVSEYSRYVQQSSAQCQIPFLSCLLGNRKNRNYRNFTSTSPSKVHLRATLRGRGLGFPLLNRRQLLKWRLMYVKSFSIWLRSVKGGFLLNPKPQWTL